MRKFSLIIILLGILQSGSISAQSLITEIERDSIVSKIVRGNACYERLALANEVIAEGDKTIVLARKVISEQDLAIANLKTQVVIYKSNEGLLKRSLENEKKISKKYSRRNVFSAVKGIAIGLVLGVIVTL